MLTIRSSTASDRTAIDSIHRDAFGPQEGDDIVELVGALLQDATAEPRLSLVACVDGAVAGHVLFTATRILPDGHGVEGRILCPLAVAGARHGQGIGSALVEDGLRQLRLSGVDLVFVLGHPGYYPRFGFQPAAVRGLQAPYPIAPENAPAWMVLEMSDGALASARGTVACSDALQDPRYWQE